MLADVELSKPIEPLRPSRAMGVPDQSARLLVRLHGRPLAFVDVVVPAMGLEPTELATTIWNTLSSPIRAHLAADSLGDEGRIPLGGFQGDHETAACSWRSRLQGTALPRAAVVLTTCGACEQLVRSIDTALAQDYPDYEVVLVDNRPATSGVSALLNERFRRAGRLRYVAEARPGLGRARNAGLSATDADIVACTDDDVLLDRSWLSSLIAGFTAADEVVCVTGLIVPVELITRSQLLLEEFGGFSKGFQTRVWDRDRNRLDHPLYPYIMGIYGSGANAAFRHDFLDSLGGFDNRLGAGTLARGGEDLDIYTRVVLEGHRLVYEPAALLRHAHVREMKQLERQIRNYGVALTAVLAKHLIEDRTTRRELIRRLPAGLAYALSPRSPKHANKSQRYPWRLTVTEFIGMAYGPLGYLRSRAAA